MASTATNRSAALTGAFSAVGAIAFAKLLDFTHPSHDALQWFLSLVALVLLFFVPFFKWVVGADFNHAGERPGLLGQWQALPEKYSRIGIWFVSGGAVAALFKLVSTVVSR